MHPGPSDPVANERAIDPRVPAGGGDLAMSDMLARNWWAVAVRGVLAILFGLVALAAPGATLLSLALLFAAYLVVDGIVTIVSAVRAASRRERWGFLLAEGVLDLLIGGVAFAFPVGAVVTFVMVTAAWALVTGILMLAAAFKLTPAHGRWWMALSGVVSMLFGIALAISPLIGAVVLTWWMAGYAIAFGAFLLVLAFRLRSQRDRPTGTTGTAVHA